MAPTVGLEKTALEWMAQAHGHRLYPYRKDFPHQIADRPTNRSAAEQANDNGQTKP